MSSFMHKVQEKVHQHLDGGSSGSHPPGANPSHHHESSAPPFPIDRPDDPLPLIPQPGQQSPGPGQLPPKAAKTEYLDRHTFYHPSGRRHNTMRDLGFTGVLGGRIVWSWGDTLMGTEHQANICAVDSTSIGSMRAPMCSIDTAMQGGGGGENVANLVPLTQDEDREGGYSCFSFGGTNIVEVTPGEGVVYYLKMHRPGGVYKCHGAGVGICSMGPGSVPSVKRPYDTMWNDMEPSWGDVGICLDARDDYLYVYGHGPHNDPSGQELNSFTYLARVPKNRALDINAYSYYLASTGTWTTQRLATGDFGTLACKKEDAIFGWHAMNQSAPFWSNYYNCWMLLHSTGWPDSAVLCKTAEKLEGPWEDCGEVATTLPEGQRGGKGMRYCVTAHPEFEPSGRRVLVTWTRENVIWGVWIEWA